MSVSINTKSSVFSEIYKLKKYLITTNKFSNVHHLKQPTESLPFSDNNFGLVVSNFAIDFMRHEAYQEAARVLAPNGTALFHFHDLSPAYTELPPCWDMRFFTHASRQRYKRPYSSKTEIKEELSSVGLTVCDPIIKDSWNIDRRKNIEYWIVTAKKYASDGI